MPKKRTGSNCRWICSKRLPSIPRWMAMTASALLCRHIKSARKVLAAAASIYPQYATHNAHSAAAIHTLAQQLGIDDYEFQCLHGMGETLYDEVVGSTGLNRPCRIYAPVGSHQTLLAYLVRRLLENGANTSFVNQIVDERIPVETLIADPFATAQSLNGAPHPHIPLPLHLFGPARANSAGVDLSDESVLRELSAQLRAGIGRHWRAAPIIAGPVRAITSQPVINPADARDIVGHVIEAVTEDVDTTLAAAQDKAETRQNKPPTQQAAILLRAADFFEAFRTELLGLAVREAGKSLPNAVAEVREAVDFLRFYAVQVRAMPATIALGAVACISPWNFPLSIFTGQIGAALAAGNAVLAKPAEQTPLIAQRAVELMHEAGVPCAALQLLPGSGETIGARLVADARIKGVIFTGSTVVALSINRTLVQRSVTEGGEIPFIAETGGQNAMIVDSSALTEQVVQDVLSSAFDSAGQRCSALRVLCLQEEIADRTLQMLRGAMQELCIGNPDRLSTDIGPVIDGRAQQSLLAHIEHMKPKAKTCFQLPLPAAAACGTFIAPTLLEIGSLSELKHEVFGPVLHVLRYRREALPQLIDAIHATGYGLTLGLHTRLDETIDYVTTHAHVGNIYVNRNIIGAVVGAQPFGGEGKSGTGPKAGGPLYLHRLLRDSDMSTVRLSVSAAGKSQHRLPAQSLSASSWHAWKNWIASQADSHLSNLAADYENNSLVGITLELPGPTGESNSLRFMPRGAVWCAAASTIVQLKQFSDVDSCGNGGIVYLKSATFIPENMQEVFVP